MVRFKPGEWKTLEEAAEKRGVPPATLAHDLVLKGASEPTP